MLQLRGTVLAVDLDDVGVLWRRDGQGFGIDLAAGGYVWVGGQEPVGCHLAQAGEFAVKLRRGLTIRLVSQFRSRERPQIESPPRYLYGRTPAIPNLVDALVSGFIVFKCSPVLTTPRIVREP